MYCKFCGNRLAGGNNKCTACKADIDFNDYGQTFFGDEEFVEWQVDENPKNGKGTNMPVTKNISSMETVKVNVPGKKKKINKKKLMLSSKNILVLGIVVLVVILVLVAAIIFATKGKDGDDKKAENEVTEVKRPELINGEIKVAAYDATVVDGKIAFKNEMNGFHIARLIAVDGTVKYLVPLREYLKEYEDFERWSDYEGSYSSNRRDKYDAGVVYVSILKTEPVTIMSTEIVPESDNIYHKYEETAYPAAKGYEVYVPVNAITELLCYGEVIYDADNQIMKMTPKAEETIVQPPVEQPEIVPENPENPEQPNKEDPFAKEKERIEDEMNNYDEKKDAETEEKKNDGPHVHTYNDEWVTITEATCTTNGVQMRECTTCDSGRETMEIVSAGHQYSLKSETPGTCSTTGSITKVCTVAGCGHTITEQTAPTGAHTYGEAVITQHPTCKEPGMQTRTCNGCGDTITETIPTIDHSWESELVEEFGFYYRKCSNCGAREIVE